jgi:hypothetical protein
MPVIYSKNFSSGTQQYLALQTASYARTLNTGASWTRLRIALLCNVGTVNETGWDLQYPALCVGVAHGIGSDVTVKFPAHCFGFGWCYAPDSAGSNAFTYNAGSSGMSYYSTGSGRFIIFKYENGIKASSTTGTPSLYVPTNSVNGTARRGLLLFDIVKSARNSGNITQGLLTGAIAHMSLDIQSSDMYAALESVSATPTVQGTALQGLAIANSLAFNETTYGSLDTVYVYWNHLTVPFCLYEIAVYLVG